MKLDWMSYFTWWKFNNWKRKDYSKIRTFMCKRMLHDKR